MPYHLKFEPDDHTHPHILIRFIAPLTWNEFHEAVIAAHKQIEAYQKPIYMVIDANLSMPGNPIPHFRAAFQSQPDNLHGVFVIDADHTPFAAFMRSIAGILQKVMPGATHVTFVGSLSEAISHMTI